MTTDPLQLLINAGAIPSSPFDPTSRYAGVPLALWQPRADVPPRAFVRRRFIAQPTDTAVAAHHLVTSGERPDLLAAQHLGDPLLYWQIADANAVMDPHELTATPGRRITIPRPLAG
jgi:hypothetical protein